MSQRKFHAHHETRKNLLLLLAGSTPQMLRLMWIPCALEDVRAPMRAANGQTNHVNGRLATRENCVLQPAVSWVWFGQQFSKFSGVFHGLPRFLILKPWTKQALKHWMGMSQLWGGPVINSSLVSTWLTKSPNPWVEHVFSTKIMLPAERFLKLLPCYGRCPPANVPSSFPANDRDSTFRIHSWYGAWLLATLLSWSRLLASLYISICIHHRTGSHSIVHPRSQVKNIKLSLTSILCIAWRKCINDDKL